MDPMVLWILVGATAGFLAGGVLGTALAPQGTLRILENVPRRLRDLRAESEQAANNSERPARRRMRQNRRRKTSSRHGQRQTRDSSRRQDHSNPTTDRGPGSGAPRNRRRRRRARRRPR